MPNPKTTPPPIIGARVFAVGSLTDAQRAFARHTPNLVVCDLKLPDGTGREFLVWVRALAKGRGRDVPCIALTGFEQRFPEARAIGFDAYLRKPVDLARLCNIASGLVARVQP